MNRPIRLQHGGERSDEHLEMRMKQFEQIRSQPKPKSFEERKAALMRKFKDVR